MRSLLFIIIILLLLLSNSLIYGDNNNNDSNNKAVSKWNRNIEQIHLAYTGHNDHDIIVSFVTKWIGATMKSNDEQWGWNKECPSPTVQYECVDDDDIVHDAKATSFHYRLSDGLSDGWNGTLHDALLTDLKPGKLYRYRVGVVHDCWSTMTMTADYTDWFIFRAPIALVSATTTATTTFAFFGDCGIHGDYISVASYLNESISERSIDFVLLLGDIPYANDDGYWDFHVDIYRQSKAAAWDEWFRISQRFATRVPIMTLPGNHETARFDDRQFIPYISRFLMPHGHHTDQLWYSFNEGHLHIIMLSSEHRLDHDSPQYKFLLSDLSLVNRQTTPWIVVATHRPMYASTVRGGKEGSNSYLKLYVEPLLSEYKVDLYISAHHHAYERSYPIDNGKIFNLHDTRSGVWKGTIHIRAGTGGMTPHRKRVKPHPPYSARRLPAPGFVLAKTSTKIINNQMIEHALQVNYISTTERKSKDQVTLRKEVAIIKTHEEL